MRPYYLLDTNIISELMSSMPNKSVMNKAENYEKLCAIPATTWTELLYGVQRMQKGKKKDLLFEDLLEDIQSNYPIIEYDNHCAWIQADIRSRLEEQGTPFNFQDTQIAAIAVSHNMILVTRNIKHFEPIQKVSPLMLENWFEEEETVSVS